VFVKTLVQLRQGRFTGGLIGFAVVFAGIPEVFIIQFNLLLGAGNVKVNSGKGGSDPYRCLEIDHWSSQASGFGCHQDNTVGSAGAV